jgi:hypothetical protein
MYSDESTSKQGRGIHVTGGNRKNWKKLNFNYTVIIKNIINDY